MWNMCITVIMRKRIYEIIEIVEGKEIPEDLSKRLLQYKELKGAVVSA